VRARVIGTRGTRTVTGPQVRAALGLRDTWFTDYRVASSVGRVTAKSSAGRARSGRGARWLPRPTARLLAGRFQPAPHTRLLQVERRVGGHFRAVARARTSRSGRYRATLTRAGVYRVRWGAVKGPPVRVR
jgi:hypothetical protein